MNPTDHYIALCHKHNEALMAGRTEEAHRISEYASGGLDMLKAFGWTEANIGQLLINADMAVMDRLGDDIKLCGGMLLEANCLGDDEAPPA